MDSHSKDTFKEINKLLANREPKFIFLSGSAGTGKTTLVKEIYDKHPKSVIVAPTGIAALNVGGKTIHSLFNTGFGPLPELKRIRSKFSKILLKKIDLLLIDEISMVRADLLDAVSKRLRKINGNTKPFGGISVLVAGDLFQLEPVVKSANTQVILQSEYGSEKPFFFDSHEFKRVKENGSFKFFELTETYRQRGDSNFIKLLDNIRLRQDLPTTIQKINDKCCGNLFNHDNTLHLASTNRIAEDINLVKLDEIPQPVKKFEYSSTGTYFENQDVQTPAPRELQLKVGARVLFIKNDSDEKKRWVNGSIGTIKKIYDKKKILEIEVKGKVYDVLREEWEKIDYKYDKETKKITETVIATYTQYPIRLGWAVTIHKSQGLTLESCSIDLGTGAFAHGQTYVALSRCKRLKNVNLVEPLTEADIKVNDRVISFHKELFSSKKPKNETRLKTLSRSMRPPQEIKSLVETLLEVVQLLTYVRDLVRESKKDMHRERTEEEIIKIQKATEKLIEKNQPVISNIEGIEFEALTKLQSLKHRIAADEGLEWNRTARIFSNRSLQEMVKKKPKNLQEMLEIYGVGPKKLEKYGQQFLDVLKDVFDY